MTVPCGWSEHVNSFRCSEVEQAGVGHNDERAVEVGDLELSVVRATVVVGGVEASVDLELLGAFAVNGADDGGVVNLHGTEVHVVTVTNDVELSLEVTAAFGGANLNGEKEVVEGHEVAGILFGHLHIDEAEVDNFKVAVRYGLHCRGVPGSGFLGSHEVTEEDLSIVRVSVNLGDDGSELEAAFEVEGAVDVSLGQGVVEVVLVKSEPGVTLVAVGLTEDLELHEVGQGDAGVVHVVRLVLKFERGDVHETQRSPFPVGPGFVLSAFSHFVFEDEDGGVSILRVQKVGGDGDFVHLSVLDLLSRKLVLTDFLIN